MIKANELRIGNLIADHEAGGYFQVESIYKNAIGVYRATYRNGSIDCTIDALEEIPLTEEWLVKLGAISNSYQDRYEFDVIHIECNKTRGVTELWIERMPHIKYIHQLQNLYFALTGQELPIKN